MSKLAHSNDETMAWIEENCEPGPDPDDFEAPEVIVCAGPPTCLLEGNDAVASQIAGCPNCRRIVGDTEYQKKAN